MGRDQGGEGRLTLGQGLEAMLRVEALAGVDRDAAAAIDERPEEIERVGVAHRHDEQCAVVAVDAEFDLRAQARFAAPRWLRIAPFGFPVVPEVYISIQGSSGDTATSGSPGLPWARKSS